MYIYIYIYMICIYQARPAMEHLDQTGTLARRREWYG